MPDPRFFENVGPLSLREIAALAGADAPADVDADRTIAAVAPLERAGPGEVSFFADRRYAEDFAATRAEACFVTAADAALVPAGVIALISRAPQAAFAVVASRLHRLRMIPPGPRDPPDRGDRGRRLDRAQCGRRPRRQHRPRHADRGGVR